MARVKGDFLVLLHNHRDPSAKSYRTLLWVDYESFSGLGRGLEHEKKPRIL